MDLISKENAKLRDRETIEQINIPSIILMENASQEIFQKIRNMGKKFLIIAGEGNNGGDGLALARKLANYDKNVNVIVVKRGKETEEFNINYTILENLEVNIIHIDPCIEYDGSIKPFIREADIVVDALFGIGLNKEICGVELKLINDINSNSKYVVSIDIPSGIECDTGKILGVAVKADITYTIEDWKLGFINCKAKEYLGKVEVINIGIPRKIKEKFSNKVHMLESENYKSLIPIRKKEGHKGNYGKVIILAGSIEFVGAAYIVSEAAVRTGSGLVTVIVNDEIFPYLACRIKEAMLVKYSEINKINKLIKDADVIACGPGLGNSIENIIMLNKLIKETTCPIVVDADGINIISKKRELMKYLEGRGVITPHPGEMARLSGMTIEEVESNRLEVCKNISEENNIVTILKGYQTVISNGNDIVINTTGSSKMASGGMGDCLTGIIASLIGQKMDRYKGALLGCYVHGYASDKLGVNRYSVNARDVIEKIPETLEDILRN